MDEVTAFHRDLVTDGVEDTALHPLPAPIANLDQIIHLNIHRRPQLDGILNEHRHAT